MRLIHTSDWHLGRRLHGVELLEHQATFLEWLLGTAVAEQADAVLVSGDVYDRAQPPADAVRLLDDTLARFVRAGIPLVLSSGNHDSAVRLQYGGAVMAEVGVHVRTTVEAIAEPVVLSDEHGEVAVYGVPYLVPDMVCQQLGADRTHEAVLAAAIGRIRADALERGIGRTVVMAHAFLSGAATSESEREIRIGGIGDTPSAVFDGVSYVALGHLHGPQVVRLTGSPTTLEYSGSPLAFSFSERNHVKSVTVVDLDGVGGATTRRIPTPVPRRLREVRGRLEDLLAGATADPELAEAWVKVTLTDSERLASPFEQLRRVWPHTLVLQFDQEGERAQLSAPAVGEAVDPAEICFQFVQRVSGREPTAGQRHALVQAVLECQAEEVSA